MTAPTGETTARRSVVSASGHTEAIRVGGEWHSVEDEVTGNLLASVTLTEQCDGCGGHEPFVLGISPEVRFYQCSVCSYQPRLSTVADSLAVWQ